MIVWGPTVAQLGLINFSLILNNSVEKSISQLNNKSSRFVQLICSKLVTCLSKTLFILSLFELLPYTFFLSWNKHYWLFWNQNSICDQIKPVKWWCQTVFRKYSKNLKCFVHNSLQGKPGCNHLRIKSCITMSTKDLGQCSLHTL